MRSNLPVQQFVVTIVVSTVGYAHGLYVGIRCAWPAPCQHRRCTWQVPCQHGKVKSLLSSCTNRDVELFSFRGNIALSVLPRAAARMPKKHTRSAEKERERQIKKTIHNADKFLKSIPFKQEEIRRPVPPWRRHGDFREIDGDKSVRKSSEFIDGNVVLAESRGSSSHASNDSDGKVGDPRGAFGPPGGQGFAGGKGNAVAAGGAF